MTPERKQALDEFIEFFKAGPSGKHTTLEEDKDITKYIAEQLGFSQEDYDDPENFGMLRIAPTFWVFSREFKK